MKKIAALFATAALACGFTLVAAPTQASGYGRTIYHHDDAGVDDPFLFECAGSGVNHSLPELLDTNEVVPGCDASRIYTRPGQHYSCLRGPDNQSRTWQVTWAAQGWHVISDTFTYLPCVTQAD